MSPSALLDGINGLQVKAQEVTILSYAKQQLRALHDETMKKNLRQNGILFKEHWVEGKM